MSPDDRLAGASRATLVLDEAAGGELVTGAVRDVSASAFFLSVEQPPAVGIEGRFELSNASGIVLETGAFRIVLSQPGVGVGVEILHLSADSFRPPSVSLEPRALAAGAEAVRVPTLLHGKDLEDVFAIGIDLGTSNTCAAVDEDGTPRLLTTREGERMLPSILSLLDDGQLVIGRAAARRAVLYPERTVYGSKRLLGRPYDPEVAREMQGHFAYPLVETKGQVFGAALGSRKLSMQEVARQLLAGVRASAESQLGRSVEYAVITVPAHFGESQRAAIRAAARGAGLTVLRLLAEPTAAAIAYGHERDERTRLVVFDLGGGTFDLTLLDVTRGRFEVVATGGDLFLGGLDLDDSLAGLLLERFERDLRVSLEPTPQQVARLREVAEKCKLDLSVQPKTSAQLSHFAEVEGRPVDLSLTITREELEGLAEPLLERMLTITSGVLDGQGVRPQDVDDVVLVGGMTRMPAVQARVEAYFGRRPNLRMHPDEAVALGAARAARAGRGHQLVDVLPLSIGVATRGRRFLRLLSRNTQVPVSREFVLPRSEGAPDEERVPLFQGERPDASANEYLGSLVVSGMPAGAPGGIALTLHLDAESVLSASAAMAEGGAPLTVSLDRQRSVEHVLAELGEYDGPSYEKPPVPPRSALARAFDRFRSLLGR
ncbi:MAG: Hsp70 family protein [Deltaproteobacteria bacterium]|nr:Hsp70 family protein [Deltaproteobacteria bacterium]